MEFILAVVGDIFKRIDNMNLNLPDKHSKLPEHYRRLRYLGSGGFAKVYEYQNIELNTSVAIKIIEKKSLTKPRLLQKLVSEIKIQKSLNHSHIVKLHSYIEDSDHVYIILDLCSHNSLNDLLKRRKRLTEREIRHFVYQILLGLSYLHRLSIIHRDIKLANILIDNKMDAKIADFGLASKIEYQGERKRTVCGTPNYIAPEVLEGNHSYEADIWSIGVLIYTMLVGYPPFQTDSLKKTYKRIKRSNYTFPDHLHLSVTVKDLIRQILVVDPNKRPSIQTLFEHDFFIKQEVPVNIPISALVAPPLWDDQCKDLDEVSTSGSDSGNETVVVEKYEKNNEWIGYCLNDSTVGVYFSDSTGIIGNSEEFLYIDKKKKKYCYMQHPTNIAVKVAVIKYLVAFFRQAGKEPVNNGVFVKKWVKKEHADIFQLSNKTLQLIFTDNSQIIVVKGQQELTYVNKLGEKSNYNFNALTDITNKDLITRIRYTHSVIKSF